MSCRTFLLPVISILAAFMPVAQSQGTQEGTAGCADSKTRPNILFIMTDQQHAGMLSCTGNPHLSTPALDALASAGVRFERAYAANPVCVPSRFSLQTGRMPSAIGMRTNEPELAVPHRWCVESLGPLLRQAGYRCVYGGKDHLPVNLSQYAMKHGYEKLTDDRRDDLARACADFLKQRHDRPFFLFASFINPHDICYMAINDFARHRGEPIKDNPDSRMCEKVLDQARKTGDPASFIRERCPPLPDNSAVPAGEPDAIGDLGERSFRRFVRDQWPADSWRLHRWLYCRLTESADAQIGTVLGALKEAGLEDKTLVIFTSDHGDMDGAHGLEHKGVLYEESVRIPFLMAWKGVIPAGGVDREHFVSNGLDLLPTLCDYAGVEPPGDLAGRSLRPLVERPGTTGWREHVVAECHNGRMIRTERFKYCVYETGQRRESLVNLDDDPGEMENLADSARHRDELNRHRRLLMAELERTNDKMGLSYAIAPDGDTGKATQPCRSGDTIRLPNIAIAPGESRPHLGASPGGSANEVGHPQDGAVVCHCPGSGCSFHVPTGRGVMCRRINCRGGPRLQTWGRDLEGGYLCRAPKIAPPPPKEVGHP